jgi:hypothetical protein
MDPNETLRRLREQFAGSDRWVVTTMASETLTGERVRQLMLTFERMTAVADDEGATVDSRIAARMSIMDIARQLIPAHIKPKVPHPCDTHGCHGHLSKYASCLAEALDSFAINGFSETTGSTEWQGYYSYVYVVEDTSVTLDEGTLGAYEVPIPADHYMVETAYSGAMTLYRGTAVPGMFDAVRIAYNEWLGDDDDDDYDVED